MGKVVKIHVNVNLLLKKLGILTAITLNGGFPNGPPLTQRWVKSFVFCFSLYYCYFSHEAESSSREIRICIFYLSVSEDVCVCVCVSVCAYFQLTKDGIALTGVWICAIVSHLCVLGSIF